MKDFFTREDILLDPRCTGQQLKGSLSPAWRYKFKEYRIVVEIDSDNKILIVKVIAHRKDVYKIAKRRL